MSDHHEPDDIELLMRLREGDVGALDLLMKRYWAPLVAYLARLTDSPDAAEDIAQRTFYRVWERRASWQPGGSVRGLVYRIAHNFAVSEHRSERSRSRADMIGSEVSAEPATPLQLLEGEGLREALARAVQQLPPRRREVFILRFVHDLPYKEIAEVMEISQQTVANQLSRALATLRELLRPALDP